MPPTANAVYLSSGEETPRTERMFSVYGEQTREKIAQKLNIPDKVYTFDTAPPDTEILFSTWGMPSLTDEQIKKHLPNLKIIFYGAGTVQWFARPFLANGVRIVSGWAANAVPVAEFTLAQIILANKGFFHATKIFKEQRRDNAHAFSMGFPGSYGCKLGIIGAGMIGRKVIEFIKNCGIMLDILVFDPFLPDEKAKEMGVHKASLEEIFAKCQTISNHLADNAQTKGIFDYKLFNLMLPNAVFINTGRGGQVVETDLARAMKEQPRRAALLDVTEPEPPEKGHVFYELDNIHLSPHIAGAFGNETYRIGQYMLDELERYLAGKPLEYEVNLQMLEVMA